MTVMFCVLGQHQAGHLEGLCSYHKPRNRGVHAGEAVQSGDYSIVLQKHRPPCSNRPLPASSFSRSAE
jgi:hypothetical protein